MESGQLALRVSHDGRWVLVSTLHAGDLLGWSALREDPTAYQRPGDRSGGDDLDAGLGLLDLLVGGSPQAQLLLRRLFGIATQHLDESRAQLLQLGREGVISAG